MAVWAWPGEAEGDLKMEAGDSVRVMSTDANGWSQGTADTFFSLFSNFLSPLALGLFVFADAGPGPTGEVNGVIGYFPTNYVEVASTVIATPSSPAPAVLQGEADEEEAFEAPAGMPEEPKKLSTEQLQQRVILEIVETERDYVKSLVVVIEVRSFLGLAFGSLTPAQGYKRQMEDWNRDPTKHVLDNSAKINVEELFSNIEDLKAFHDTFAGVLAESAKSGVESLCQSFLAQVRSLPILLHPFT